MHLLHRNHPFRIFWFSGLVTIALGVVVALYGSLTDLWLYAILVMLEVTFSFDNAVINSRVLSRMSRVWQFLFLTVGIFIAVFVVRFALPVIIVMIAGDSSFVEVLRLAIQEPDQYSYLLHESSSSINAFGGVFLLMIGVSYFFDRKKDIYWLEALEEKLSSAARFRYLKLGAMLSLAATLYLTVDETHRQVVLIGALAGIVLHSGLQMMSTYFHNKHSANVRQVGWAAFASFMYLEVLDASFSFDSVIGAFAITSSVLLIITGLGAGAIWVRSLTIYLLRTGTLGKYRYLEHGAHWAILALGIMMILKLYGIELPEWMVGSLGLVFIGTAVLSSILEKRRLPTGPNDYRGWS